MCLYCVSTCLNATQLSSYCTKDGTCMHLITVYGTHTQHTHVCVDSFQIFQWRWATFICRASSGFVHFAMSPFLLSESFSKSYAAPPCPSLQCKLRRGILRGFLCGSQVKNWPACQIIISENERLKRIPQCSSLWTGRQSTKDTRFSLPLESGIWLPNIIFLLSVWGLKHMLLHSKHWSDFWRAALLWSYTKTTQRHSLESSF